MNCLLLYGILELAKVLRTLSYAPFYRWTLRPREDKEVTQIQVVSKRLELKCPVFQPKVLTSLY